MAENILIKISSDAIEVSKKPKFENQYMLDNLYNLISKQITDVNLDYLNTLNKMLDPVRETIEESIKKINHDFEKQSLFMMGELSAITDMINEYANVLKKITEDKDLMLNPFLERAIDILNINNGMMTHANLSDCLELKPSTLTMKFKRNEEWRKYISTYVNPIKGSSTVYQLNARGKSLANKKKTIRKNYSSRPRLAESYDKYCLENKGGIDYAKFDEGIKDFSRTIKWGY